MLVRIFICVLMTSLFTLKGFAFESIQRANEYFSEKEWVKARTLLMDTLIKDPPVSEDEKAAIYNLLSVFFETKAENYKEALLFLKKVDQLKLEKTHPAVKEANERLRKILTHQKAYRDQLKTLNSTVFEQTDVRKNLEQIKMLKSLIRDNTEFPEMGSAYYYLGSKYLSIGQNFKAYKSFKKAMELVPAIDFKHPVQTKFESSIHKFNIWLATYFIWGCGILLPLITVLSLFHQKTWTLVGKFHFKATLITLLLLLSLGIGLFFVSAKFLPQSTSELVFQKPIFEYREIGEPESRILIPLFLYSTVAIFISVPFIVLTSGFRLRYTMIAAQTASVSFIFLICFFLFYFRYCEDNAQLGPGKNSMIPYLSGTIMFETSDIFPYVLTAPRKYQELVLINVDEAEFTKWVEEQYSIIDKEGESYK